MAASFGFAAPYHFASDQGGRLDVRRAYCPIRRLKESVLLVVEIQAINGRGVIAVAAGEEVGRLIVGDQRVVTAFTEQRVDARPADQRIVAAATEQGVVIGVGAL